MQSLGSLPDDILNYQILDYLPFRELYSIRDRYPDRYQEILQDNLSTQDGRKELLLFAIEVGDNFLLEEVLNALLSFRVDIQVDEEEYTEEVIREIRLGYILADLFVDEILGQGDIGGAITFLNWKKELNNPILDRRLRDNFVDLVSIDDPIKLQTLLDPSVVAAMDDNFIVMLSSNLMIGSIPGLELFRRYRKIHGGLPIDKIREYLIPQYLLEWEPDSAEELDKALYKLNNFDPREYQRYLFDLSERNAVINSFWTR